MSDSEIEDLLFVTGEKGTTCAERLGLDVGAALNKMIDLGQERLRYWRTISSDPFSTMNRRDSAAILADSYAHILARVREASTHRKAAEELLAYEV